MNPLYWRNWTSCLWLAVACLAIVGCGGGDLPNPDADGQASADQAPTPAADAPAPVAAAPKPDEAAAPEAAEPPTQAAAPAKPAQPVAAAPAPTQATPPATSAPALATPATPPVAPAQPQVTAAVPAHNNATPATPPADANTPASAEAGAAPAQAKPDTGTTTAEMLALSAANAPAPPPDAAGGQGTPGNPGAANAAPNSQPGAAYRRPDDDPTSIPPAMAGRNGAASQGRGRADELGDTPSLGRQGGRDGLGAARDNSPADYTNPQTAVKEFLAALEDKNVERLSEATALRAPTESATKHQELFRKILDGSISEAQLNELAELLEGYNISGVGQVKSTGQLSILISKQNDNGRLQRTMTVRKEKAGWKVLDISSALDFRNPNQRNRGRGRTGTSR